MHAGVKIKAPCIDALCNICEFETTRIVSFHLYRTAFINHAPPSPVRINLSTHHVKGKHVCMGHFDTVGWSSI